MTVIETERLALRELNPDDAMFLLELLNEPSFVQNIGDRGVRTIEDADQYMRKGPIDSYRRHGFGLWAVELRSTGEPMGLCGLVKRDFMTDVDIGYAFLPRYWSKGYAQEAAAAVLQYAAETIGLKRIAAIVSPGNAGSIRLLEKLGLRFERMIRVPGDEAELKLFAADL